MIYYSTGKSPYLKGRGKPINIEDKSLSGNTAELLLQKGYVVKTIEELNERQVEQTEIGYEQVVEDKKGDKIVLKKERKKRETKKAVKAKTKRNTNR